MARETLASASGRGRPIDRIVLTGGGSLMPLAQRLLHAGLPSDSIRRSPRHQRGDRGGLGRHGQTASQRTTTGRHEHHSFAQTRFATVGRDGESPEERRVPSDRRGGQQYADSSSSSRVERASGSPAPSTASSVAKWPLWGTSSRRRSRFSNIRSRWKVSHSRLWIRPACATNWRRKTKTASTWARCRPPSKNSTRCGS